MHCRKVKDYLERYADGTLATALRDGIKEHLSACSACESAYIEIGILKSFLKGSALTPMPEDITTNIMAEARNSFFSKQSDETGGISFLWWKEAAIPARMAFVGILVIVSTAGVFMGKKLSVKPSPLTVVEFPELDAFSAAQEGSLSYVYLNLTMPPH